MTAQSSVPPQTIDGDEDGHHARASGVGAATADQVALFGMIGGFRLSQAISVAAKLGLADLLAEGGHSADELAELTGTHAVSLRRLLRALAGAGIFQEDEASRFSLTPKGDLLRRDVPGSLHGQAALMGERWVWESFGDLVESVRTGEPAFDRRYGIGIWDYLTAHPDAAATFDAAMTALSALEVDAVVGAYRFDQAARVVDVGGGHGALLASILGEHPAARGVVFDRPGVVVAARQVLDRAGVGERCETIAGDMFSGVPAGGDVYILKRVLHDWDDQHAIAVLRSCRSAIVKTGSLILAEPVISPGNTPHPAKLLDLQMLVAQRGRERTIAEFQQLLQAADFRVERTIPTGFLLTLIEATAT